ncbi:MAG: DUF481 domain-containing protein [Verrucomicrobiota bacterium]
MKNLTALIAILSLIAWNANADVVKTKDGSVINGQIQGIEDGKLKIKTAFGVDIEVAKDQIDTFTTEGDIFVSMESGASYKGKVSGAAGGNLTVATPDGELKTSLAMVNESWTPDQTSPAEKRKAAELKELKRKWAYQSSFDLSGKSGNSDATGLAGTFRATLAGSQDKLELYAAANFQETDGDKSADDARGGVQYSNKISDKYNWYVRTEFGRDAIKDIDLFTNLSAGFGRVFVDNEATHFDIQGGIGYRYEAYDDTTLGREDLSAASLDFGAFHSQTYSWGKWTNRLTFTPTIEDLGNFRLIQDSAVTLPLKKEGWSLRFGLKNDYDSEAVDPTEELDTTYYSRLILNWD